MNAAGVQTLIIHSSARAQAMDITERVQHLVAASGIAQGLCSVYVTHTTAGICINENADPDVLTDFLATLDRLVPWEGGYRHAEGNAAAHIKATLIGTSQTVPVRDGRLTLGRWQGIFFVEFDGPRERQCLVSIVAG
ncbi:MAG TPA: secondary thiamine-phosphate synthase enzyme YjbQ [Candidatus Dormibacteraeota bacterium]|jgi:secondary thiamine-phosphate synthase enzyme